VRFVLFYESADDVLTKAPPHFPADSARLDEFHRAGTLLMMGPFGNPQSEGSMSIFITRGRRGVRPPRPVRVQRRHSQLVHPRVGRGAPALTVAARLLH